MTREKQVQELLNRSKIEYCRQDILYLYQNIEKDKRLSWEKNRKLLSLLNSALFINELRQEKTIVESENCYKDFIENNYFYDEVEVNNFYEQHILSLEEPVQEQLECQTHTEFYNEKCEKEQLNVTYQQLLEHVARKYLTGKLAQYEKFAIRPVCYSQLLDTGCEVTFYATYENVELHITVKVNSLGLIYVDEIEMYLKGESRTFDYFDEFIEFVKELEL